MTTENWINVAMIIAVIMTAAATLVGPVLAVIVQVRMSQPKPTPTASQPDEDAQNERRRQPFHLSPKALIVPVLGVAGALFMLVVEFLIPTPLTRWSVLTISFGTAVIAYNLAAISILVLIQVIIGAEPEPPS